MAPLIGIIGGSGVYAMKEAKVIREITVDTPFGAPSDNFILAELNGVEVFLLSHQLLWNSLLYVFVHVSFARYSYESNNVAGGVFAAPWSRSSVQPYRS